LPIQSIDRFADIVSCDSVTGLSKIILGFGNQVGYERTLLAIVPDRITSIESKLTFIHGNFSTPWIDQYQAEKLHEIDPVFAHCVRKSGPLIWSPEIFITRKQKEFYEDASSFGLRSGIALPIHGPLGELGVLCFANDMKPDHNFQQEAHRLLPVLSYFRDLIFEASLRLMQPAKAHEQAPPITSRELECLKWCVAGKSSWEIAQILRRSEATVNFHFTSLRQKFSVSSRQQVVLKAIRFGLIHP
jgi:LuxR family quorum-sensing transcriptional regulator LasR